MRTILFTSIASVGSIGVALAIGAGCAHRECNAQNDCPMNDGCTADGHCVALPKDVVRVAGGGSSSVLGNNGGDNGGANVDDGAGAGTNDVDDAAPLPSLTGTLDGTVGPVVVTNAPATVFDDCGATSFQASGEGADALVWFMWSDPASKPDLVTPGSRHYGANDLTSAAYGQVCTTNESQNITHYDEPADLDVDVALDGSIAMHWKSGASDVTGHFTPK